MKRNGPASSPARSLSDWEIGGGERQGLPPLGTSGRHMAHPLIARRTLRFDGREPTYRIELTGESQRKRNIPPPLDGADPDTALHGDQGSHTLAAG